MLARSLTAATLAAAAVAAAAQPASPRERTPAPLTYRSAFEGYRPYVEEPLAPWRAVNDAVERVGGHAGVLRAETQPAPAPSAAAPAAPKETGHDADHRK